MFLKECNGLISRFDNLYVTTYLIVDYLKYDYLKSFERKRRHINLTPKIFSKIRVSIDCEFYNHECIS